MFCVVAFVGDDEFDNDDNGVQHVLLLLDSSIQWSWQTQATSWKYS